MRGVRYRKIEPITGNSYVTPSSGVGLKRNFTSVEVKEKRINGIKNATNPSYFYSKLREDQNHSPDLRHDQTP